MRRPRPSPTRSSLPRGWTPGRARYLFADVAAGLAERLARAAPRFGPDPASSFAWTDAGVRDTLAALVADGDAEEAEAVVSGMVAAGVPASEIGAGLALGLARAFRGPWPLIVLERAVRLADRLGEDAARVVLPVAAHGCAVRRRPAVVSRSAPRSTPSPAATPTRPG